MGAESMNRNKAQICAMTKRNVGSTLLLSYISLVISGMKGSLKSYPSYQMVEMTRVEHGTSAASRLCNDNHDSDDDKNPILVASKRDTSGQFDFVHLRGSNRMSTLFRQ